MRACTHLAMTRMIGACKHAPYSIDSSSQWARGECQTVSSTAGAGRCVWQSAKAFSMRLSNSSIRSINSLCRFSKSVKRSNCEVRASMTERAC